MSNFLPLLCLLAAPPAEPVIGAKSFSESVVLQEILTQLAEYEDVAVRQKPPLEGSQWAWQALLNGDVDVYPDYTGTLALEILQDNRLNTEEKLRAALARRGVLMSGSLGFNNNYAIGMKAEVAQRLKIRSISDLRDHPNLRFGFGNEFLDRADCWPTLKTVYRLPQTQVRGLAHSLAYQGIVNGDLDAMDIYTTDASIEQFGLVALEDDLQHFPPYSAVFVYRADLQQRRPELISVIRKLQQRIDRETMLAMNIRVDVENQPEALVAHDFLRDAFQIETSYQVETIYYRLWRYTLQHLFLVSISLGAAILVAIPLGVTAAKRPALGQVILGGAEMVQTIPGLALLVFLMAPVRLFGISGTSAAPVIVALFLYSLLPIIRNTFAGMRGIPNSLRESALALGLTAWARLWRIELPMASPMILAGIKTTAVINVGYATLGGLIGAGGYGELIMQGLRKSSEGRMLEGAIPAAILALLIKYLFEGAERFLVPRGLRLAAGQ